jgi:hypothetical protein
MFTEFTMYSQLDTCTEFVSTNIVVIFQWFKTIFGPTNRAQRKGAWWVRRPGRREHSNMAHFHAG